ncbi:hypothetical protein K0B90_08355 [bacterium]|nr:hypothetical protein [bacterium]
MIPDRRSFRILAGALLLASVAFSLSACGVGGTDYAGGGTGGTGISTGAVTGYGSVVVNDVHYNTNAKTKKISNGNDNSAAIDQDLFRVGMVVTIRYSPSDNNAREIEYRDHLEGPISSMSFEDNTFGVLGLKVVVDNGEAFAKLSLNDFVVVSGFVDSAGRIRATYIERKTQTPRPPEEYEVKGFVSGLSTTDNTFLLGLLPDGSVPVVTVFHATPISGFPGGLENGAYVQVTTNDTAPSSGRITGTRVEILPPRTDFPEKSIVDLEGLVTAPPSGSGNGLSFAVEGKVVRTKEATVFAGGKTAADIQRDARVLVRGTEAGGVLSAVNIIIR